MSATSDDDRVRIRTATPADAAVVAAIYAPYVSDTAISFEVVPPSADEMRRRIETTLERYPWLICEEDGVVLGYAYASVHHAREAYQWSVGTAIYVDGSRHRKGVGRRLYSALFPLLVRHRRPFRSLTAQPSPHAGSDPSFRALRGSRLPWSPLAERPTALVSKAG